MRSAGQDACSAAAPPPRTALPVPRPVFRVCVRRSLSVADAGAGAPARSHGSCFQGRTQPGDGSAALRPLDGACDGPRKASVHPSDPGGRVQRSLSWSRTSLVWELPADRPARRSLEQSASSFGVSMPVRTGASLRTTGAWIPEFGVGRLLSVMGVGHQADLGGQIPGHCRYPPPTLGASMTHSLGATHSADQTPVLRAGR